MCCFTGASLFGFLHFLHGLQGLTQHWGLSGLNTGLHPPGETPPPSPFSSAPRRRVCDTDMTPRVAPVLCWRHYHPPSSFTCNDLRDKIMLVKGPISSFPWLENGDPGWKRFSQSWEPWNVSATKACSAKSILQRRKTEARRREMAVCYRKTVQAGQEADSGSNPGSFTLWPWVNHEVSLNLNFVSCKMGMTVVPDSSWSHED